MAIPIFLLSIGILFSQSRDKVKKEATMHAASVVNTTMQHFTRFMEIVETSPLSAAPSMPDVEPLLLG